ncbi:MAG TPA: BsuPI-related putative proteinase inhibitor [Chthoniobacteraceae bacterium]|nr:BsuPI-related putative proteinase inhibitor [Chthoniobacteraceae bacterium]
MKLSAAVVLLVPFLFAVSAYATSDKDTGAKATPTPTLLDDALHFLHLKHPPGVKTGPLHHGLELQLDISPDDIALSTDHEIKVTVTVFNRSAKQFTHLDFPTSQRIEVLVKDASGKVVNTWSEDQSFTNDPASVNINPGERIEYSANVATREMTAGKPYTIEASFPSYPNLTVQKQVTPGK